MFKHHCLVCNGGQTPRTSVDTHPWSGSATPLMRGQYRTLSHPGGCRCGTIIAPAPDLGDDRSAQPGVLVRTDGADHRQVVAAVGLHTHRTGREARDRRRVLLHDRERHCLPIRFGTASVPV